MKTIQIQYQTKEGTYLCDINVLMESLCEFYPYQYDLFEYVYEVLKTRYGVIKNWEVVKWYN